MALAAIQISLAATDGCRPSSTATRMSRNGLMFLRPRQHADTRAIPETFVSSRSLLSRLLPGESPREALRAQSDSSHISSA